MTLRDVIVVSEEGLDLAQVLIHTIPLLQDGQHRCPSCCRPLHINASYLTCCACGDIEIAIDELFLEMPQDDDDYIPNIIDVRPNVANTTI